MAGLGGYIMSSSRLAAFVSLVCLLTEWTVYDLLNATAIKIQANATANDLISDIFIRQAALVLVIESMREANTYLGLAAKVLGVSTTILVLQELCRIVDRLGGWNILRENMRTIRAEFAFNGSIIRRDTLRLISWVKAASKPTLTWIGRILMGICDKINASIIDCYRQSIPPISIATNIKQEYQGPSETIPAAAAPTSAITSDAEPARINAEDDTVSLTESELEVMQTKWNLSVGQSKRVQMMARVRYEGFTER